MLQVNSKTLLVREFSGNQSRLGANANKSVDLYIIVSKQQQKQTEEEQLRQYLQQGRHCLQTSKKKNKHEEQQQSLRVCVLNKLCTHNNNDNNNRDNNISNNSSNTLIATIAATIWPKQGKVKPDKHRQLERKQPTHSIY